MNCRPSEFMGIYDSYTAFCFDEACAFIIRKLKDGDEPVIKRSASSTHKTFTRPSELYRLYENRKGGDECQ